MTNVLITGANRGIGLALVEAYAADATHVYACCRAPGTAHALASLAEKSRGPVSIHPLDVTDPSSIASLRASLASVPLDILINNAGINSSNIQTLDGFDYSDFQPVFATNTIGPLRMAQAFRPNLAASREKKLVTISSILGSITNNTDGAYAIYRASKAAVNQIMRGLAHELRRHGIISVLISPGYVKTDMAGPDALLEPHESASGLKRVIHSLKADMSGQFLDYRGKILPW